MHYTQGDSITEETYCRGSKRLMPLRHEYLAATAVAVHKSSTV